MNSSQHPVEQVELMAFLDGELPGERAAAVAAHLQQCGECRVAVAESRGLAERLTAWQVEPAPASLAEHVTATANSGEVTPHDPAGSHASRPRFPQFAFPKWVWAAVGVLGLFLIFVAMSIPNLLRSRQSAYNSSPEQLSGYISPTAASRVAPPLARTTSIPAGILASSEDNRPGGAEAETGRPFPVR